MHTWESLASDIISHKKTEMSGKELQLQNGGCTLATKIYQQTPLKVIIGEKDAYD